MPSKLQLAIGAVKDQTSISLAKVSYTPSPALEVAVLKATTHDDDPTDEKIVHDVLQLVSSEKFHAAACARAISKRLGRTRNWMVALKSLMLVLRIFQDGDPYFPREVLQAMKRGAKILNLASFRDESSSSSPWDFTSFVRTFALYLDERLECFLTGKLQRRRWSANAGKENPTTTATAYRRNNTTGGRRPNEPALDMKPAVLIDRIMYWQRLLDRAIAMRPTGEARINCLVQICLYAVVQESFDLYKDISDGLSLILDSFFHLQFQNCVNVFHACAKAAKQFKELTSFYTLCKSIGIGRSSEYPAVQTISEDLIESLEQFLNQSCSFSSSKSERALERESSQCASLEDLIKATATEASTCPAISIDLEDYAEPRRDEAFMITSPVRSISEIDDREQQQQQRSFVDSSPADNWELVLAETLCMAATSPLTISGNNPTPAVEASPSDNWELILFAPSPPFAQQPPQQNKYCNPFLDDPSVPTLQHAVSMPTFHAIDPFPEQFHNQTSFTKSSSMDQQDLMREQQKYKIIA